MTSSRLTQVARIEERQYTRIHDSPAISSCRYHRQHTTILAHYIQYIYICIYKVSSIYGVHVAVNGAPSRSLPMQRQCKAALRNTRCSPTSIAMPIPAIKTGQLQRNMTVVRDSFQDAADKYTPFASTSKRYSHTGGRRDALYRRCVWKRTGIIFSGRNTLAEKGRCRSVITNAIHWWGCGRAQQKVIWKVRNGL